MSTPDGPLDDGPHRDPARSPLPPGPAPAGAEGPPGARRAIALLGLSYFFSFGGVGLQVPLLTPSMSTLGFSAAVIGGLWAVRSTVGIFAPALIGVLADRLRADRALAAVCLVGAGASVAGLTFVLEEGAATLLFAGYGLFGTASVSLVDGMVLTALGPHKRRYGRVRLWGAVGFGVVALTATQLGDDAGLAPSIVFLTAGGLAALAAVAVVASGPVHREGASALDVVFTELMRARIGLLAVLAVFHWAGHGAYTAFITPLAEAAGLDRGVVGWALATSIVVEVLALRTADLAVDRVGEKRLLQIVCAMAVVRWVGLAVTTGPAAFVLLHGLHGVTFGWFYPTVVTLLAGRVADRARQGAQGVFTSGTFGIGGALGMAVAGAVLDAQQAAPAVWATMAALNAVALLAALGIRSAPSSSTEE